MTSETQFKDAIRADATNLLRDQILETIYDSTLAPDDGDGADKESTLKQEYNRLYDELGGLLKPASPMDPLALLPPEVWTEIIRETAERNVVNLPPTDALLLLTLVSREWSGKIVGTPGLWTNITVGRGEADAQAKLASVLYLIKDLEFGITIDVPPCQWEDDLSLLRAHAQHLKRITFRFSVRGYFGYAHNTDVETDYIDDLFTSLGPLPSLRVLRGSYGSRLSWDSVFERCPNLTYIYETIMPLEVLRTRNPVPIRACSLETPCGDIIPCLDDLSYLEEVNWVHFRGDTDVRGKYGSLPTLPALRRVSSNDVWSPNILTLLKLTERLTWLGFRIEGNWQHFYDFFLVLEHLCHLRDLKLHLGCVEGNFSFPVNRLAKTGVQYLQLSGPYMGFGRTVERDAAFMNHEAIFSAFPTCFPGVTRLELCYTFLGPKMAAYIQSATRLMSLTLAYEEFVPEYHGGSIKSSALSLKLSLYAVPIASIECPSISRLTLEDYSGVRGDEWGGSRQIQHTVKHLDIGSPTLHLLIPGFHALQKLRIYERSSGISCGDMMGEVFIPFICEPTICPLLSRLQLDFIPEWDLLFLMLERRNYLPQSRRVSRIKTLILRLPPPPHLLLPLMEILAGRFTVRPSNEDISVSSFMEAYFDPNMCVPTLRLITKISLIIFCP